MSRTTVTLDGILDGLKATPARIAEIVSGRPPAHLNTAPEPDGWSANAVLAHLRACADQWGGCFERILAEDRPTLRAISPRAWIRSTDYLELDFGPSVSAYTAQRAELLSLLEQSPPQAWSRTAIVTGAGAPLERTVKDFAHRLVRHEQPHLKQTQHIVTALQM